MFGNPSDPTRIFSYGAKAPTENLELVSQQMALAHRYRNRLVELEFERRAKVNQSLRELSPNLLQLEADLQAAESALDGARTNIRENHKQDRKRTGGTTESKRLVAEARQELRDLRVKRKETRTALFQSDPWKAKQEEIDAWTNAESKRLRSECGVFWGSYLFVEQSCSGLRRGAPPKFMRWNGDGHLAVQIQGGMTPEEAFGCLDNRLRIKPLPDDAYRVRASDGKLAPIRSKCRTLVHFRIESTDTGKPIWAGVPITLHRPLPQDARIKWVHLIRKRIATKCEWKVQFVLSRPSGWDQPDRAKTGRVGIDVGWRMNKDRSLRVAYYIGDDGGQGELTLPADWLHEMRRTEKIHGYRDDRLNIVRPRLARWLDFQPTKPDWLVEGAANLAQWKSPARFAALAFRWKENRFSGDETVYKWLEVWRRRDRHLYEFEANLRDQLQHRREDIYRVFVAKMRRAYKTAVIEDMDLRDYHKLPEAENDNVPQYERDMLKTHLRDACLSLLRRCLVESMAEIVAVPAENTTRECPRCFVVTVFDSRKLDKPCQGCGMVEDQDKVAATVLLQGGARGSVTTSGAKK